MPVQTSSIATAGNLTKYEKEYTLGAVDERTYDQFATPMKGTFEPKGATISRSFLQAPVPRPTAAIGNENTDFEPQTIRDSSGTLTMQYLADGLKWHDLVALKSSLLTPQILSKMAGALASKTIDALARRAATEGNLVKYGGSTQVSARTSLDLGTAGHRMSIDNFTIARAYLGAWMKDDTLFVIIDPFQYSDLLVTNGGVVTTLEQYKEKSALYNFELGTLAGIRIIVSPHTKAFYSAGAANASAVSTTIATSTTANKAGATTIEVAANTNIVAGMWLTVGTVQTSTESDDTLITEIVNVAATPSGTTVTVQGSGNGGGLKYDHAVAATVKNADTVHCAVFGNSQSLNVGFDQFGRYGQLVPPFQDGNAKQWTSAAFKYFGGYAILDQTSLMRQETSASLQ